MANLTVDGDIQADNLNLSADLTAVNITASSALKGATATISGKTTTNSLTVSTTTATINSKYPVCANSTAVSDVNGHSYDAYTGWVNSPTSGTDYGARWWYKDFAISSQTYRLLSLELSIGGNAIYEFSWSTILGFSFNVAPRYYSCCLHTSQTSDEPCLVKTLNTTSVILYQSNSGIQCCNFTCFGRVATS